MIDVLMSVLTFFVILTMTLTGQVVPNVELPQLSEGVTSGEGDEGETEAEDAEVPELLVGFDASGQILLAGEAVETETLLATVGEFLEANPGGVVTLNADRNLDYSQVDGLLEQLAETGGDRVLLVVE